MTMSPRRPDQSALVLDLLREQRRVLGHETLSGTLRQRRELLKRGALIGLAVVGGAFGLLGLLGLQRALVRSELQQLQRYEAQASELDAKLQTRQQSLAGTQATNRKLADALTSSRTSSALLTALQLTTPQGIQILSVEASDPDLVLKGQAYDPLALMRINALQLQLARSPLFDSKGIELSKVERIAAPAESSSAPAAKGRAGADASKLPPPPGPLTFEIRAPFASLDASRQLALLQQFGSVGMARRLNLLRTEGLMP